MAIRAAVIAAHGAALTHVMTGLIAVIPGAVEIALVPARTLTEPALPAITAGGTADEPR